MPDLFDDLTRALGSGLSRREAFRLVAGGAAGAYLNAFWPNLVLAANPHNVSPDYCKNGGQACFVSGERACCFPGLTCCAPGSFCCDPNLEDCCKGAPPNNN